MDEREDLREGKIKKIIIKTENVGANKKKCCQRKKERKKESERDRDNKIHLDLNRRSERGMVAAGTRNKGKQRAGCKRSALGRGITFQIYGGGTIRSLPPPPPPPPSPPPPPPPPSPPPPPPPPSPLYSSSPLSLLVLLCSFCYVLPDIYIRYK